MTHARQDGDERTRMYEFIQNRYAVIEWQCRDLSPAQRERTKMDYSEGVVEAEMLKRRKVSYWRAGVFYGQDDSFQGVFVPYGWGGRHRQEGQSPQLGVGYATGRVQRPALRSPRARP